ncbi:MAG: hypothetical protein JJ992_13635 [Planctomycetes bacterium]|nr:hypothetical protein [Planctomycetota bacterium]
MTDVAICFGQEDMLYGWSESDPAKRKGAINFVVGVNGTGKSSLLRAVHATFRALRAGDPPPMPITLAWDRRGRAAFVTAVFHLDPQEPQRTFFSTLPQVPEEMEAEQWRARIAAIASGGEGLGERPVERGSDAWKGSFIQAHLPRKLISYTTGAELLWEELEQSAYQTDWEDETGPANGRERSPG